MTQVSSATSAGATGTTNASQTLSSNYELFLTLLTTQVKNQDPLDPLDSAEYTNQLVQYSSVEQSIQTNKYLENLVASFKSGQASSYVNYIGSEITAAGGTTALSDGSASWKYNLKQDASGTVEIKDSAGNVVFDKVVNLSAGSHTYTWDGKNNAGGTAPDGSYTIAFSLKDADGNSEGVSVEIKGVVDGLDLNSDTPFLKIGDVSVPVSAVKTVKAVSS